MKGNGHSKWELFILVFGLERSIFRLKLIVWLVKCVPLVFRGCEDYPVPKNIFERLAWYKKRFFRLFGLYKWMMDDHKKGE